MVDRLVSKLEFIGGSPNVFLKETESTGRGLFASSLFRTGDLILSERPFVSVSDKELLSKSWSNEDGSDSWALALEVLRQGMLAKTNSLHPRNPADCPPLDQSLVASAALTEFESYGISADDLKCLLRRVQLNSIGCVTWPELLFKDRYATDSATCLFEHASLFNHSCDPNVFRYSLGDVLVFRAGRDIYPGEELCISYIPNEVLSESKIVRTQYLDGRDFTCHCPVCHCDENLIPYEPPTHCISEVRPLLREIDSLNDPQSLTVAQRAELNLLTPRDRYVKISEYIDSFVEGDHQERLTIGDLGTLLTAKAASLEIARSGPNPDRSLVCFCPKHSETWNWKVAYDFAVEVLPPYDFTIAVLLFHLIRVGEKRQKILCDFLHKHLRLNEEDISIIFQNELRSPTETDLFL